jgi:hypothetical protein
MSKRIPLNPANIDSLKDGHLNDPKTPGLSIEVTTKGAKTWRYRRRVFGSVAMVKLTLGHYPLFSIADARVWADDLNVKIEGGIDPRAVYAAEVERSKFTVAFAHGRYMEAVREGRASSAKKRNRPRTVTDKLAIFRCDIAPTLSETLVYDVTEEDLAKLVLTKGRRARVRANRLAAELKVFFGWAASLRGKEIGLTANPAVRLTDLKFPEAPRDRKLGLEEIKLYLRALVDEPLHYQRGMLLWLLTAARISEVIFGRTDEIYMGVWTIPPGRAKNARVHRIELGPWGLSLVRSDSEWLFPSDRIDGPRAPCGWYDARNRVLSRMSNMAGREILRWTPHDLRRTARSNTKRLGTDFETAEAMLNHQKKGLERIYDGYELEDEKRAWFLVWENEIIRLAKEAGTAEELGVPEPESRTVPSLVHRVPRRRDFTKGRGSQSRRSPRRA